MIKGFRLEGQIGRERSPRTTKNISEYTAGNINDKGVNWMTDKAPNADMLTREGDEFDKALKRAKKIMTLAIPEKQMQMIPYTEKQYIETFRIYWFSSDSKGAEDFWRMIVFHHVTVKKIIFKDLKSSSISFYQVLMQIEADVEYLDKYGTKPQ